MDEQRKHEINELSQSFGPKLQEWVKVRREELILKLIANEDASIRGAIKELDYLIGLSDRLQQEISAVPQEEGGLA